MITGLPDGYHLSATPRGYLLSSERLVYRNDPNARSKDPLVVGKRHVAVFRSASQALIRKVANLDARAEHAELSHLMREHGAGVIRWGNVDTQNAGLPKAAGRNHEAWKVEGLQKKRRDAGFGSAAAFSRACGVADSHILRIEAGVAKAGRDVLEKLAKPLRMDPEDLIA